MYAGGPEPGNHARVPVMRARRQSKGLPRRPSVPRANGPAVEASAPGRRGPQGAMTQPGSLPDAVAAGIDRAKGSAQRRASGSRKRPALCRPSATARQPASHQQCSATASQPGWLRAKSSRGSSDSRANSRGRADGHSSARAGTRTGGSARGRPRNRHRCQPLVLSDLISYRDEGNAARRSLARSREHE